MNHLKIYELIIQKAKSENRVILKKKDDNFVYYDNHHIIPACLNGSDDQFNRQLLTDKEHYVCHKLLTYIYPGNRKLGCAFHFMTFGKNNKNGSHIKSARDYAYARELMRLIPMSEETRQKFKNRKHSEETKKKISKGNKGKNLSENTREKIRQTRKNKGCSKREKNPMFRKGYLISGEKNGMYHRNHTEDAKEKMQIKANSRDNSAYRTKEFRDRQSENTSGKNNGMFKRCSYDIWVEKYGKEEANKRNKIKSEKLSKIGKGKPKSEQTKQNMRHPHKIKSVDSYFAVETFREKTGLS